MLITFSSKFYALFLKLVYIQISWLLMKPADQGSHFFHTCTQDESILKGTATLKACETSMQALTKPCNLAATTRSKLDIKKNVRAI